MENDLEKFCEYGKIFEQYLRPLTFPIGIKLIKSEDELPENCKRPTLDLKLQNFMCRNFKMVRTYGWTMAVTEKDCVCRIARVVYGWDPITEEGIKLANQFSVGLYSKDVEASEKWLKGLYVTKEPIYALVMSPLTRTKIIPDIVQIYCNPAQATRLIQAYLYVVGGKMEFSASGRGGSCHEGVIKTIQTDQPQFILLGNGDRVWGGAEDYEVMFSIPKNKIETIIEGLEVTHKAGLRYPIPKYMNYKPSFQMAFKEKAKKRAGGTIVKE